MLQAEDDKFLRSQQPLLEKWYLEEIIGEGSSGTVYRITDNTGSHFALKVIPIMPDGTPDSLSFTDSSPLAKRTRLDEITTDILSEIKVMQALKDHKGIVSYYEYGILENSETHTRFICIRMDLLQPLNQAVRMREGEFTQTEITSMGIDLLTALSECRRHNIIHRDIKPSNIFITKDNQYLLGDFGSARSLEKTMMASHKGTLSYMAPEIAAGLKFNSSVDIYSLGIVLYQLLNNRRLPFLDASFKFADMEPAIEKRLSGVPLPCPENADRELGAIICKMCAYSPKDRYHSPEECLKALSNYQKYGKKSQPHTAGKWLPAICALSLIPLLFIGSRFFKAPKTAVTAGISSGNVNSSGAVASDNNWLYFSQDLPGECGIRMSKDGTQKEVLCDYIMHDINLTDDFIVFTSRYSTKTANHGTSGNMTGLYRMNKDGSSLVCLDHSTVYNPVVYGGYIYYFKNTGTSNLLCKLPTEGGQAEVLGEFNPFTFYLYPFGDALYLYDNQEQSLIALSLTDGTKTVVIDRQILRFCIEDGFLYYSLRDTAGFDNHIYVHELNANAPATLAPEQANRITFPHKIFDFNVSGGVIYASSNKNASHSGKPQEDGIWRVNRNGGEPERIYTGSAYQLQITDRTLYFAADTGVYAIDLDGSNLHEFEEMTSFYLLAALPSSSVPCNISLSSAPLVSAEFFSASSSAVSAFDAS